MTKSDLIIIIVGFMIEIDIAIIGGGPAGIATAIELSKIGYNNIIIFDRNKILGGILNQCIHPGFGLELLKQEMTGPEFAGYLIDNLDKNNIHLKTDTMVVSISNKIIRTISNVDGFIEYKAKAVILATGCRERTRENIEIPGSRPAGIYKAGQAQNLINILGLKIGKKVIIQGSGDIGLIMARRLTIEGYDVIAVLEKLPYLSGLLRNKVQCLDFFDIPLILNAEIIDIIGSDRVEKVKVRRFSNNKTEIIEYNCDTIIFSVGLIPENELAKKAGVKTKNNYPQVYNNYESEIDGIFFCGNCLHIHDIVDDVVKEAKKVAKSVDKYFNGNSDENIIGNFINDEQRNTSYNSEYFDSLKEMGSIVCIICPKGCIMKEGNYGCARGELYYHQYQEEKSQRLTTTIGHNNRFNRYALISKNPLAIKNFKEELIKLKDHGIKNIDIESKYEITKITKDD